ncbi:RNA-binding S4 domain-containing protein [Limisalsivibrio acetivorans]|uniref:RNA-binding S4 domain-containing protein n=1 Tax=Limisalsivibrio acetivorans TaxID=1304888 RepID=UPI0003B70726|nr:RNA-binding S4 domain-containing protein [Limisalsivibrio acetivorans]
MRLDKFLKSVNLIKRRTVANEAADEGFVLINGRKAKPSSTVKEDDILELDMWNYYKKVRVIQLPGRRNVSKKDTALYIEQLEYNAKSPADIIELDEEE